MLYEVMKHIHNFFPVVEAEKSGKFEISGGAIGLDFVQDGQWYLIEGSVFNDGVYKYGEEELEDEIFNGTITPLAIPKAFIELVGEIEDWQIKNGTVGPYNSESFGGYSYTVGTTESGNRSSWANIFAGRLNTWRKL